MSQSATTAGPARGIVRTRSWFPAPLRSPISPNLAYALRTLLAVVLAVYVSYTLMLENPFSAATTVLIVSNPMQGALLSKSAWRIVGTLAGATAAVTLIALFAQAPYLFVIGMACWIGICAALANLLRHFRAYAMVLAGYTVAIVAIPAISDPDRVFDIAMSRISVVSIGVCSAGLVAALLQPRTGQRNLTASMGRLYGAVAHVLHAIYAENRPKAWTTGEQARLLTQIHSLDDLVAFTTTESADVALREDAIREALAKLASVLSAAPLIAGMLQHAIAGRPEAETRSLRRARDAMAALFADLSEPPTPLTQPAARRRIEAARDLLHDLPRDLPGPVMAPALALASPLAMEDEPSWRAPAALAPQEVEPAPDIDTAIHIRILLNRLDVLLGALADALDGLLVNRRGPVSQLPPRFRYYQDPIPPLRNGARAFFAIIFGGTFWIETYWSSGTQMLSILGQLCGLVAISPSPARMSVDFLIGTVIAMVAGFIVEFCLLPQTNSFPLLMLAIAPFIVAGVMKTQDPRYAGVATAYMIWFSAAIGITNPIKYDLATYLNSALAFILAACFALLSYRVLFPPSARTDVARVAGALRRDVARLPRLKQVPNLLVWENLQQQKLVRIAARISPDEPNRAEILAGSVETLILGRLLIRLRLGLQAPRLPEAARPVVATALHALGSFRDAPEQAGNAAIEAGSTLAGIRWADGENATALLDAAALLREIGELIHAHAPFLAGKLD